MTTQPCECRDQRLIQRIRSALNGHEDLSPFATTLLVSVENAAIILQGHLPSDRLRSALEPVVRQAGVLGKIENRVRVIERDSAAVT